MRRTAALLVASSALLAACGPATHLNLQLRSVGITVPRLVTPAVELVPPATTPVPVALPPVPPITDFLPPPATPSHPLPPVAPPPAVACPKAGQFDVPALPASPLVDKYPAAARYTQRSFGQAGLDGKVLSLDGSLGMEVVRLPSTTTSLGQQVDSWRVVRRLGPYSSVEVYDLVHAFGAASATPPGIYLVGLAWDDPVRGKLTFQPTGNGLEILPDPVSVATQTNGVAAQYAGAATDPNSLTTMSLVRNVLGRKRIDTCGKLVDTYTVDMTGVLVSPSARYTVHWTQQLATAYGGVEVESVFALQEPVNGFSFIRTLRNTTVPVMPA